MFLACIVIDAKDTSSHISPKSLDSIGITGDSFLYPICKECNDIGKGDGNHPFLASKELMQPFNFSDADIEND